jgi:cysteine synthase
MPVTGNTPLIKLHRISEPRCVDIYGNNEGANPTGELICDSGLKYLKKTFSHEPF